MVVTIAPMETKLAISPKFLRDTVDLVRAIETSFLELGRRLYIIRDRRVWKDNESFKDFLDEARISHGVAVKLINVYEAYVVKGKIGQEN